MRGNCATEGVASPFVRTQAGIWRRWARLRGDLDLRSDAPQGVRSVTVGAQSIESPRRMGSRAKRESVAVIAVAAAPLLRWSLALGAQANPSAAPEVAQPQNAINQ